MLLTCCFLFVTDALFKKMCNHVLCQLILNNISIYKPVCFTMLKHVCNRSLCFWPVCVYVCDAWLVYMGCFLQAQEGCPSFTWHKSFHIILVCHVEWRFRALCCFSRYVRFGVCSDWLKRGDVAGFDWLKKRTTSSIIIKVKR